MALRNLLTELLRQSRWQYAPKDIQTKYYERTADFYDDAHVSEGDAHNDSLHYVEVFIANMNVSTVLDTGCGSGRAARYLKQRFPDIQIHGSDPSPHLLRVAAERHSIPMDTLHCFGTLDLPFSERIF